MMLMSMLAASLVFSGTSTTAPLPPPAVQTVVMQQRSISHYLFNGATTPVTFGAYATHSQAGTVYVKNGDSHQIQVQKKTGSAWATVLKLDGGAGKPGVLQINGPEAHSSIGLRGKAGTSGVYRLYLPATATSRAVSTPSRTIKWESPKKFSGSRPFGSASSITVGNERYLTNLYKVPSGSNGAHLERKVNGKWKLVALVHSKYIDGVPKARLSIPTPKPGTSVTYRVRFSQTETHSEWVSPTQTVRKGKIATDLRASSIGGSLRLPTNITASLEGWVGEKNRQYQVQQYSKGKWVKHKNGKTNGLGKFIFKTPKTSKTFSTKYRIHFPATSSHMAATTKAVAVKFENPRHYTGYKKTIYKHIKRWCPNITIDTANRNGMWDGKAQMLARNITLVKGMSGERLKHVALHECAHVVGQEAFRKNGVPQKMYTRLPQIYGGNWSRALEHAADCMAKRMGAKGPFAYTNQCGGARGTAAKKMIAGKLP